MLGAFGILLPTVGIGVYCVHAGKYLSLIWVLPSLFAFLTSSPGLNAIALGSYFLIIMAGIIIGVISDGFHHLVAGFIPGVTWFAVGALKGTTMVAMEEELKESEDSYHRFRSLITVSRFCTSFPGRIPRQFTYVRIRMQPTPTAFCSPLDKKSNCDR
jgi:hypothetical protein